MTIETLPSTRIHLPGSPEFTAATRLWNGAVTHRPAAVARPTSRSEVQSALRYVADSGMPVAVRGGGHDWAGRALIAGGLVIDLSLMRRVDVDVTSQTAFVSGGSTAADVVAATEPFGLVPATGTYGGVGIVGLTLAGGYGPLNGIAGLALDNVIAFEVVLHDGTTTIAHERHEPDLFWALRGGGGNFGVVTGMRVRLHALDSVIAGFIGFPWQQAEQILRRYDVLRPTMPDELTVQIGVLSGPDGNPIVFMAPAWSGTAATGVTWIDRLQRLGTPVIAQVGQMPYSAMLGLFDPRDRRPPLRAAHAHCPITRRRRDRYAAARGRIKKLCVQRHRHSPFPRRRNANSTRRHGVRHPLGSHGRRDRRRVGPGR